MLFYIYIYMDNSNNFIVYETEEDLTKFIQNRKFNKFNKIIQSLQNIENDLINLISKPNINVMEIVYNPGNSADIFLNNNSSLKLTTFYLDNNNNYTTKDRQTIIRDTIPQYIIDNPETTFDIIYIDGTYDYNSINNYLDNCMKLANKDTIVILDDTLFNQDWIKNYNIFTSKAWTEHITNNLLIEIERKEYAPYKGLSWGKFVLP